MSYSERDVEGQVGIKPQQVKLYYFGDRSYIDVYTLSRCFYEACGMDPVDTGIESESIRILKVVKYHGFLSQGLQKNATCHFWFSISGKKHIYSFIESQDLINERRIETLYHLSEHIWIKGKFAGFMKPLTSVMAHNLMVLGKALVVANSKFIPRVVRAELKFNLTKDDYQNLSMEYIELNNNFALLRSSVSNRHHSDVFVKLLGSD